MGSSELFFFFTRTPGLETQLTQTRTCAHGLLQNSHKLTRRTGRPTPRRRPKNSDATVCFNDRCNIGAVLERLQHIRTNATSLPQDRG